MYILAYTGVVKDHGLGKTMQEDPVKDMGPQRSSLLESLIQFSFCSITGCNEIQTVKIEKSRWHEQCKDPEQEHKYLLHHYNKKI